MSSQLAQETISADEAASFAELTELLSKNIEELYPPGNIVRRDAHPKMHGLVKAEFVVNPDLPQQFHLGVFQPGKQYPAWVRFSNQNAKAQSDNIPDIRGMAVKLMHVPGEKLLSDQAQATTHDFITISATSFVTRNTQEFVELVRAMRKGWLSLIWFFLTHIRSGVNLLRANKVQGNPLHITYNSVTPYLFGEGRAVRYCLRPQIAKADAVPDNPGPDFMREALVQSLRRQGICFDFMVQLQTDAKAMPIEDPGIVWDEARSPFIKLAELRIPQQECDSPEQRVYGENLSFNPWHALPEHRPLGGINRARRVVYEAISKLRHAKNHVQPKEPDHYEI
ncbi:catalase family protein [Massilia sp. W12]|uniref:catalase family protein n=1 Tax=Massilia sp. W12 TaxID=3126507 RepID=UPI0030CC00A8